jgi:phenylpropionate dioxygenase-like ring-hydroxylating dioxygenase large terminal subunit
MPSIDPADLFRDDRVHRAVYVDPEVFAREQDRVFRTTWLYAGHESQVPSAGDYAKVRLGPDEVLLVREGNGSLAMLHNRCPHRGSCLVGEPRGHLARFRCPYHAWTFGLDGHLIGVPMSDGYSGELDLRDPALQLTRVARVESYRGFIFASHAAAGPSLPDFLGSLASALDNMVDRAPAGTLTQAGGTLRMAYRGNWKLFMENATDLVHPSVVHESSVAAARAHREALGADPQTAQTLQMLLSNGLGMPQWAEVPLHADPHGHVYMGGFYKSGVIAPARTDPVFERYRAALVERHGETETARILGVDRFNNLIWPNLSVNARFGVLRQVQPVSVNHTVISSTCFRFDGAPDEMFDLTLQFLNTASSASSMVASDDLEIFERCQRGLEATVDPWIDIRRGRTGDQRAADGSVAAPGTSELPIRNQLQAWLSHMQAGPRGTTAR